MNTQTQQQNSNVIRIATHTPISNERQFDPETAIAEIKQCAREAFSVLSSSMAFQQVAAQKVGPEEYKQVLQEIYYQTRETPGLMGQFGFNLSSKRREGMKTLFKHASAEMGHDQMALADLETLGVDRTSVETQHPLPATSALIGYAHYQTTQMNPVGFLGFIYFLEFLPSMSGHQYADQLEAGGVPRAAMTFIEEHAHVDVAHTKLLDQYVRSMVRTVEDLEEVKYCIRTTAYLYGEMIGSAIRNAKTPFERGQFPREIIN